jgi:hypothetical protein
MTTERYNEIATEKRHNLLDAEVEIEKLQAKQKILMKALEDIMKVRHNHVDDVAYIASAVITKVRFWE